MFERSISYFRILIRVRTIGFLVAIAGAFAVSSAERIDQFFGVWLPQDQNAKCNVVAEWGEGPQLTIGKNTFVFGDAAPCEMVKMFLVNGKLRISASCGWEGGYRAAVIEFDLPQPNLLIYNNKKYVRCIP